MGRYSLIFEPKYVTNQYAVSFDNVGNSTITRINKYSDTPVDKGKLKKNNLSEIDRITASCEDLSAFFKEYVPSSFFMYCGNNLHKMFIGYMYNKRMYTVPYIINNPELLEKMKFVSSDGVRVNDVAGITAYLDFIKEDTDNKFLRFILQQSKEKTTALSTSTIELIGLYKSAFSCCDYGEAGMLRRDLETRLGSYKEYREMFLLHHHYQDKLAADKKRLEELKNEAVIAASKPKQAQPIFEGAYDTGVQLTFFDDLPPQKTISKK